MGIRGRRPETEYSRLRDLSIFECRDVDLSAPERSPAPFEAYFETRCLLAALCLVVADELSRAEIVHRLNDELDVREGVIERNARLSDCARQESTGERSTGGLEYSSAGHGTVDGRSETTDTTRDDPSISRVRLSSEGRRGWSTSITRLTRVALAGEGKGILIDLPKSASWSVMDPEGARQRTDRVCQAASEADCVVIVRRDGVEGKRSLDNFDETLVHLPHSPREEADHRKPQQEH